MNNGVQTDTSSKVKYVRIISNIVYLVGVICVLVLGIIIIFGSDDLSNPDAMVSVRYSAFIWLIVGMIPMILSCVAVYIFNNIKISKHKIRNTILIFTPGFICFGCFLFLEVGGIIMNLYTKYFSN
jgi:ABC-type maltose transport system permease subunit